MVGCRRAARTSGWSAAATWPRSSPRRACSTRSSSHRTGHPGRRQAAVPAPLRPALVEVDRNKAFIGARYGVVGPRLPPGSSGARDRSNYFSGVDPCVPFAALAALSLTPASSPSPPRREAAPAAAPSPPKARHGVRLRRRGHLGRPLRHRGRPPGAQARRQRRRRRGRHRGRARRDRAVQRRHRRWRLLRPLRRRRPARCSTIDGRETAPARDAARRVHRPGDRQALQLHARAGHQRRLGRRARHAGDLAARARPLGHAARWPSASRPADRARRAAASWSTRPSAGQTLENERAVQAPSRSTKQALPAAAATRPQVGSIFRNPDLADTYRLLARKRHAGRSTDGALAGEIVRAVRKPPKTQAHRRCRCRRATCGQRDLRRYRALDQKPDQGRLPRARRLRHGAVVVRRHHGR